ncbi:MAG: GTPase ObgE [Syntrophales bacterium]|nr:GTPase ObgE [Syntrophales bacterium]
MRFIDEAKIKVKAGNGGRGCVSFRREKYIPRGGPDGGDGGKGGDVIIRATSAKHTLLDFKYRQHFTAKNGGHGEGNKRTGANGEDLVINVPLGTIVRDASTGEIIADLTEDGQTVIVAKGGLGGKGNARFATPVDKAPRYAQPGLPGEEKDLILELKLIADVGIVGLPNVGKSTFLSRISAARPKIADYPFTTLAPHLGVVSFNDEDDLVFADIPGILEGAHNGVGMGVRFLRHIERTSILFHIIDISQITKEAAWNNYKILNKELSLYDENLAKKPQVVGIGKIDIPETKDKLPAVIDFFGKEGIRVFPFSAITGEGVDLVLREILSKFKELKSQRRRYE